MTTPRTGAPAAPGGHDAIEQLNTNRSSMQRNTAVKRNRNASFTLSPSSWRALRRSRLNPMMRAVAAMLTAGVALGAAGSAQAQRAFSPGWMAQKNMTQDTAAATGRLPNGQLASTAANPLAQQQQANALLQRSMGNLNLVARSIAAQQAAQTAAQAAALNAASNIPDGLGEGGLKIDTNSLTAGWLNANAPTQGQADGRTKVTIEQTGAKAILNWETFNVGKNTTVEFKQQADWAVLNRVNDPLARPSQIQGRIQADGTVMLVNRNGIVFSGSSQVNTRNLVAAAVGMSDSQFAKGLYSDKQGANDVPTLANDLVMSTAGAKFSNATGDVLVQAGARIATKAPQSVTEGGGYVLLAGREAQSHGSIATPSGQTLLAAGDSFVIRKGVGTTGNQQSSTRGNEVDVRLNANSTAGLVRNTGLIEATTGDITLTGRQVEQAGVLWSTTSVNTRGTLHLNAVGDKEARVTLAPGSVSAVVLDDSNATALDVQRAALIKASGSLSDGAYYNRRDQSLVQILSSGDVAFDGDSLTLATGGQIGVNATRRTLVAERALLDVSGAVGVQVAMATNNVAINVQGNEQRDAPVNRDSKLLNNANVWIDRRYLVRVPAGTNGANGSENERWYTAGGLLEVGGYLNTGGHTIGEWASTGGTVNFGGGELVTRAGSSINVAGGTLDVLTGVIKQTWLNGPDGKLYNLSNAPGDVQYKGVYRGFESEHKRWGAAATEAFYSPFIAASERLENGYTVGRDAGRVVVATRSAVLEGDIDTAVYQGPRQQQARDAGLDGYAQSQTTVGQAGRLIIGQLTPVYDGSSGLLRDSFAAMAERVDIGDAGKNITAEISLADAWPKAAVGKIALDAAWLNGLELGGLAAYATGAIEVSEALTVVPGGSIALHATQVDVNANLTARGGSIALGNIANRFTANARWEDLPVALTPPQGYEAYTALAEGVILDTRGLWTNLLTDAENISGLPYINGGSVTLASSGDVLLAARSLIDTSSGAALLEDGSQASGRGGNITLRSNQYDSDGKGSGTLLLAGELRGHGALGGGTLTIDSGIGIALGGGDLAANGVLPAGASVPVHLTLTEAFTIAAGTVLPNDFSYTTGYAAPGKPLGTKPIFTPERPYTLAAAWVVPASDPTWQFLMVTANGKDYYSGGTVPAGATLTFIGGTGAFPISYVAPTDAFPNGMPVAPYTTTVKAGTAFASAVTLAAGERVLAGTKLPGDAQVKPLVVLNNSLFSSGFSKYAITAQQGVQLAQGAQVNVTMPVLALDLAAAQHTATGAEPSAVLQAWLPPLWQEDAVKGVLTQRAGADIALAAGTLYARAPLVVGQGASLTVDPGRSISLVGNDQITIDGTLTAHAGRISVLGGNFGVGNELNAPVGVLNGRSIWLGDEARLDVSGLAATAQDVAGRTYGRVSAGGSISIGADYSVDKGWAGSIDAFVVLRPGAVLDASGAAATLDVPGLGPTLVAGNGGTIALSSARSLFLDGEIRASAGGGVGGGAAGGTLAVSLDTLNYGPVDRYSFMGAVVVDEVRVPHEILLSQVQRETGLASTLETGQWDTSLAYGRANLGVDRIQAGGFGNLALQANGLISFDGNVSLNMAQSLRLTASAIGLAEGAAVDSQVHLVTPYLRLAGSTPREAENTIMPNPVFGSGNAGRGKGKLGVPEVAEGSALLVEAALIDIVGETNIGARGSIVHNSGTPLKVERFGFDDMQLRSSGDIRFGNEARFYAPGNLTLAAVQLYPMTGASATVSVGMTSAVDEWGNLLGAYDPKRHITVQRVGTADPAVPYSAFGSLTLAAATVNQGGVLRAPLGNIQLGNQGDGYTGQVNLLPGSITSVSAQGLVMPYGSTVDGLTYVYNGADVKFQGVGFEPSVTFFSHAVDVRDGAVIDLRGGGELTGAGFLSGRGGSTDARLNPLVQYGNNSFKLPGLATNPVYAIVPGVQAGYAPVAAEKGAGDPALGRQITIGAGVPGLAAGTYTLLPSTYALLPGAFRVELNGLASGIQAVGSGAQALRNGSWAASAQLSIANTQVRDALPAQAIVTSAETLRRYSQYNEMGLSGFALAQAESEGIPRAILERDAKALVFNFFTAAVPGALPEASRTLQFSGQVLQTPAKDGRGSSVNVSGQSSYEILATGAEPTADFAGISIHAQDLNAIGAARMVIGGSLKAIYTNYLGSHQEANIVNVATNARSVVLRSGAELEAAEVFLITGRKDGGITLEQGAGINTLKSGDPMYDGTQGFVYAPGLSSVLAVSNGWLDLLAPTLPPYDDGAGPGAIHIGACDAGVACSGDTRLYAKGTITAATDKAFTLADSVRYGARNLVLAVGAINVGSQAALADAATRGLLPDGLTLNQDVLNRLLRGDTSTGAPALENLALTARDAVNFYGSTVLSTLDPATGKSSLKRLVLGTPAIYGLGGADDVARIETDTLVWSGAVTPPGDLVQQGAGTGSGRLDINAREIEFGFGPNTRIDSVHAQDRLALGFAQVNLNARERITANASGSLAVYQSRGAWDAAAKGYNYSGGALNISTPLMTGDAGSVNRISAGGDVRVSAPAGATTPAATNAALAGALGAELSLDSRTGSLLLDTAVLLPSGKLSLSAQGSVALTDAAKLDLAGRKIDFFDVSKYSWGGDVLLESRAGDITQSAGSSIDLSAKNNRAGKLSAIALGSAAGTVNLAGRISGSATGHYDAGGTMVPYAAGQIDVRGQHIADFTGLNTRLTTGGVVGGRAFQLKQGDLVLGSEVKASEVDISVDNGSLLVNGTIDASGEQVGSIRLAANRGVTLAGTALLDAHATVLRVDSYGKTIEAPNRAVIELDSGAGRLVIASGAHLDLRAGNSAQNFGTVTLNAPRLGGATGNDVDIDVAGPVSITGAKAITVNAFHTYTNATPGTDATTDGGSYQVINQAYLNGIHGDSTTFMGNALGNGNLMNMKLGGLRSYSDQFHLRPGVEIAADTRAGVNPDGNLHVDGDIDLSGYRYASVNPHLQKTAVYGSGEAAALVLRAAGDLEIFGSITDGFDTTRLTATPDDTGWILPHGRIPYGGDVVVPHGQTVTLAEGTFFQPGRALNYDLPMQAMSLAPNTRLPATAQLTAGVTLAAGTVLGGDVRDAAGVLHVAGTLLKQDLRLDAGTQLGAGMYVPAAIKIAAMTWPAGVALPRPPGRVQDLADPWNPVNGVQLAGDLTLKKGALIPGETLVRLPGGAESVALRPAEADGSYGRTLALAPMLAAGSASWDLRLVAGADLQAADNRLTVPHSAGQVRLSDTHYGLGNEYAAVPGTGQPGVFRWALDMDVAFWESVNLGITFVPGELISAADVKFLSDALGGVSPEEVNDWGYGPLITVVSAEIPAQFAWQMRPVRQQNFSVLRTGTGDLDIVAAGNVAMTSPFGVYTAGTQAQSLVAAGQADPYNLKRGLDKNHTVLHTDGAYLESLVDGGSASLYQAWYPEQGGNVLVRAGGAVLGDLIGLPSLARQDELLGSMTGPISSSMAVGNWLWRQGTGQVIAGEEAVPTAWWINFGTYMGANEDGTGKFGQQPKLMGFTGIGTLGGGNLVLEAGADIGSVAQRGDVDQRYVPRSTGLSLAVASTGRMTRDGQLVLTGGGDLDIRIGGRLNPARDVVSPESGVSVATVRPATQLELNSTFVNLRGALNLQAGAVGAIELRYDQQDPQESRPYNVSVATSSKAGGGPVIVPGDAGVRIDARGDLVLGGVVDAGRVPQFYNGFRFSYDGVPRDGYGWAWFSLWTPSTALDLFSAGGNLTPGTAWLGPKGENAPTDGRFVYPSQLRAVAASGNLYYGSSISGSISEGRYVQPAQGLVLAPSPVGAEYTRTQAGQLELLAADSIYAGGYTVTASGADPTALPSPFNPGFTGAVTKAWFGLGHVNQVPVDAHMPDVVYGSGTTVGGNYPMFSLTSPSASGYAAVGQQPARFYAVAGDAVGIRTGTIVYLGNNFGEVGPRGVWYEGGGPVAIMAGRDIVSSGTTLGSYVTEPSGGVGWSTFTSTVPSDAGAPPRISAADSSTSRGNLIVHNNADDVSVVSAGRDIRYSSFYVAGPGTLEVTAGRDLYMADKGELRSLGAIVNVTPGDRSGGANIAVAAGMGAQGGDYKAFAERYLNPANQADLTRAFADQAGKALYIYSGELTLGQWLRREFGYSGDEKGAAAFMAAKQTEIDKTRQAALAAGTTAANRSLDREYRVESQLHLVNWLTERFGEGKRNTQGLLFDAASMDARKFFDALPAAQQRAFLRDVYYAELKAGGREYNAANGPREGSYLRGREAIATLLPEKDGKGQKLDYSGDLTMFSSALYYAQYVDGLISRRPQPGKNYIRYDEWLAQGSPGYNVPYYKVLDAGIHTDFGGDISLMVPGGRALVGVDGGFTPAEGSGLLTQGEGDINIYAKGSLLLGQSRIFTTFGGNILAWSAEGDINAGRGSKTTVVYTPQRRVYDDIGLVSLSPTTPNTGAGIATLNPIPQIPPGDIDLIAPLGTIDAGEAGIRVSGNVNLAALHVVNAENIQVQGKAVGIPVTAAVNVGALSNASAAASQAAVAAQDVMQRERSAARQAQPSVFTVRVLGTGQEAPAPAATQGGAAGKGQQVGYNPDGVVQVLGAGVLTAAQQQALTESERKALVR
jgi:filamentous hemagglutinin family protein